MYRAALAAQLDERLQSGAASNLRQAEQHLPPLPQSRPRLEAICILWAEGFVEVGRVDIALSVLRDAMGTMPSSQLLRDAFIRIAASPSRQP
jgi:thioredoxin-like negative regulator of GroEL